MKVYIAGKITGIEAEARVLFADAARRITENGDTPLNPMGLVDQTPGRKYGEYLADALRILLTQAEAVLYLDNWWISKGARIEFAIAQVLEIEEYKLGE